MSTIVQKIERGLDQLAACEKEETSQPAETTGILGRIRERRAAAQADEPVRLASGWTVSGPMAKFLREHPGAKFLGVDFNIMALKTSGGRTTAEPWDAQKHSPESGWSRRVITVEYATVELADAPTPSNANALPQKQIWMCRNRNPAVCIGARLSPDVLRRITGTDDEKTEVAK